MKHVIIHHNDSDGYASAAVVFRALTSGKSPQVPVKVDEFDVEFVEAAYGKPLRLERSSPDRDAFYMVDFMIQPVEKMREVIETTPKFLWIDHHRGSCEAEFKDVCGVRSTEDAACVLCWKYFFPDEPIPLLLRNIADYDTWKKGPRWETDILPTQYLLRSGDVRPFRAQSWWQPLLENFDTKLFEQGKAILTYVRNEEARLVKGSAWEGEFDGMSAVFYNGPGDSSLFEKVFDPHNYDLLVTYRHIDGNYWTISLYTYHDDVNCREIAERVGLSGPIPSGGGHVRSSGFQTTWAHFTQLAKRYDRDELVNLR